VAWVGTRKVDIYTVTDRDRDRVADEVEPYASPLDFAVPNGVCISKRLTEKELSDFRRL